MWIKKRNILAFPYGWQRPAKTEEWTYDQCLLPAFAHTPFTELVCFPWATLIDLLRKQQLAAARPYLKVLESTLPRTTLIRATVCQHIWAKDMLHWFRTLKITDLYWPHATLNEPEIEGIRVHPFPLYPVRCDDHPSVVASGGKPLRERRYLYSFVGAYSEGLYLTRARQWIFGLPRTADACVVQRDEWHYEKHVYGEQVSGKTLADSERRQIERNGAAYADVLNDSIFSLCPSGSGPNSIRLWESLGFGCIPVVMSDSLRLPGNSEDWEKAVIRIPETRQAVGELPKLLSDIAENTARLHAMREAGRSLWRRYGERGPLTVLGELTRIDQVREWTMGNTRKAA